MLLHQNMKRYESLVLVLAICNCLLNLLPKFNLGVKYKPENQELVDEHFKIIFLCFWCFFYFIFFYTWPHKRQHFYTTGFKPRLLLLLYYSQQENLLIWTTTPFTIYKAKYWINCKNTISLIIITISTKGLLYYYH